MKRSDKMEYLKNVFFLRHLKTNYNVEERISGQADAQISFLKDDCQKKYDLRIFQKIYTSPAGRCIDTLKCLNDNALFSIDEEILKQNIVVDERLLERDMGSLEGMKRSDACLKYPALFRNGRFNVLETPPNGESLEHFQERIQSFALELEEELKMQDGKILICGHNQSLKMLSILLHGEKVTWDVWKKMAFKNGEIVSAH